MQVLIMKNHIEKLHDICNIINATPIDNYATVMEIAAVISKNFFEAHSAFIFLLGENGELDCASDTVPHPLDSPVVDYPAIPLFYTIMKNERVYWGADKDGPLAPYIRQNSLIVPLIANGKSFGITLINSPSDQFADNDSDIVINTVFSIVSSLIFNGIMFREKQKSSNELSIKNDELAQSLAGQETLLTELHHRVKNNLQIILSLIHLQLERLKNPEMTRVVQTIEKRIRSIAIVHEKMLWKEAVSSINFNEYIRDIVTDLNSAYRIAKNMCNIMIEGDEIFLSLTQAVPCGLIINEAVTNSLKYAFADNHKNPEIRICTKKDSDNTIDVRIADNGTGFVEEIDVENCKTLGLMLMHALATTNLKGTFAIESNSGLIVSIRFKTTGI